MAEQNIIYKGLPEKFWVVTKCWNKYSTLEDICFESSIPGMIRQHIGGLNWEDILGIHAERTTAESQAKRVLRFKGER